VTERIADIRRVPGRIERVGDQFGAAVARARRHHDQSCGTIGAVDGFGPLAR